MIFGFVDVSMTLETDYVQLWIHEMIQNNSKRNPNHFNNVFGNLKNLVVEKNLAFVANTWTDKSCRVAL